MIALFTDFGLTGPYTGQVKAVLARLAPGVPVIDLLADAPAFQPQLAAYLLPAYLAPFRPGDILLAVVDPGVGGPRRALVIEAEGLWLTGPDNGLFELLLRRAASWRAWAVSWRPDQLSASFHGRDLFAPVAARLALGEEPPGEPAEPVRFPDWPDDLPAIVYVDHYGNAMTGLRAKVLTGDALLEIEGRRIRRARTFSDVAPGEPLWYENANGLAEIAVNGASAAEHFRLVPGTPVTLAPPLHPQSRTE